MSKAFPSILRRDARVMLFVDGENLAIRYKELVGDGAHADHISQIPDVFVWSEVINKFLKNFNLIRRSYFTSARGDESALLAVEDTIRSSGFESARVFKRPKGGSSKRVDIAMVCEMMAHGFRDNYDCAIIVTGDEDFVPAVQAITGEGKQVVLWHMPTGCSPALRRCSDHAFDLGPFLAASGGNAWTKFSS